MLAHIINKCAGPIKLTQAVIDLVERFQTANGDTLNTFESLWLEDKVFYPAGDEKEGTLQCNVYITPIPMYDTTFGSTLNAGDDAIKVAVLGASPKSDSDYPLTIKWVPEERVFMVDVNSEVEPIPAHRKAEGGWMQLVGNKDALKNPSAPLSEIKDECIRQCLLLGVTTADLNQACDFIHNAYCDAADPIAMYNNPNKVINRALRHIGYKGDKLLAVKRDKDIVPFSGTNCHNDK